MAAKKFSRAALEAITLPPQLLPTVADLMRTAEAVFGPKTGAEKKAWVKARAIELAGKFDLKNVPNWIENPAKEVVIGLVVDILWGLGAHLHGRTVVERGNWTFPTLGQP